MRDYPLKLPFLGYDHCLGLFSFDWFILEADTSQAARTRARCCAATAARGSPTPLGHPERLLAAIALPKKLRLCQSSHRVGRPDAHRTSVTAVWYFTCHECCTWLCRLASPGSSQGLSGPSWEHLLPCRDKHASRLTLRHCCSHIIHLP